MSSKQILYQCYFSGQFKANDNKNYKRDNAVLPFY